MLRSPAAPLASAKGFAQIQKQAETARGDDRMNDAIRPTWAEGWWWLGSLLYDQDRFAEARVAFQRFTTVTPDPGPGLAFLGLCEYETRDYDHARQHFRAWATQGWAGTPELIDVAVFHFALLLTRGGRFVEALYLLATEAGKSRNEPALAEAMGLASLQMASLPENYPPERREILWLAGSAALAMTTKSQQLERGQECSRKLVLHYGKEPNVHYLRGTLLSFEFRNNQEAANEFREELEISPQHVPAMVELARIGLVSGQTEEAATLARRALKIDPKSVEAHHRLGQALLATRRFQESAKELEIAKQLAPRNAQIRFHLSAAYRKLGQLHAAERERAAFESLREKREILSPPERRSKAEDTRMRKK